MSRILVVDDDRLVLASIHMLLVHHGFDAVAVDHGRRAVQALEQGHFDTVIVDIFMPGMDGYETIAAFHKLAPDMPIIAMSGARVSGSAESAAPDFLAMAGKMGAVRTLYKPFRPEQLIEAVRACVDTAARPNETRKDFRR